MPKFSFLVCVVEDVISQSSHLRKTAKSKRCVFVEKISPYLTAIDNKLLLPELTLISGCLGAVNTQQRWRITLRARFTCVYATIMDALAHNLLLTTDSYKVSVVPTFSPVVMGTRYWISFTSLLFSLLGGALSTS